MEIPNYFIPTTDERFQSTYDVWRIKLLHELTVNLPFKLNHPHLAMSYVAIKKPKKPKIQFVADQLWGAELYVQNHEIDDLILCFDSAVFSLPYLRKTLAEFLTYSLPDYHCELQVFSAYEITELISEKLQNTSNPYSECLVDEPIPDVNCVLVSLIGPKTFGMRL